MHEKILIVEDEKKLSRFIELELQHEGYRTTVAFTGKEAVSDALAENFDLILLDIMIPEPDGIAVCKKILSIMQVPIIFLTAKSQTSEKVEGLDSGAVDYITKPFGTGELLARVRAALRNTRPGPAVPGQRFQVRGLSIDYDARLVTLEGQEVRLTQTEFNIVALLAQHAGKVLTYSALIQGVWGVSDAGSVKKLQVNMANIRKKLGARPGENPYILNELGVGYRMYSE